MRYSPRPYIPHLALRRRAASLERELLATWEAWEACGSPSIYEPAGVAYMMRVHTLRAALTDTLIAIERHKKKARGVVK